eukprot:m.496411 g.496411  ORF g.496411 m.496411 type:complete len:119 (+) comp47561_c0_seq1:879-1235(+)
MHDIFSVAFGRNGLLVSSSDLRASFWDYRTNVCTKEYFCDTVSFLSVDVSPDGSLLGVATDAGIAIVWDLDSGAMVRRAVHTAGTHAIAFSNDSSHIATGSFDGTAGLWPLSVGLPPK